MELRHCICNCIPEAYQWRKLIREKGGGAIARKYNKSNKIDKNDIFKKRKKLPLDYVLKIIPVEFVNDQSILKQRKLGMMNLTELDRQRFFSLVGSWSYMSETHPKFFLRSNEQNHRRKRCAIICPQGFQRIKTQLMTE